MIPPIPTWLMTRRHWDNQRWCPWCALMRVYWCARWAHFHGKTAVVNALLFVIQLAPIPIGAKLAVVNTIARVFYDLVEVR